MHTPHDPGVPLLGINLENSSCMCRRTNGQWWSLSVTTKITKKEAEATQVLINRKANALVTAVQFHAAETTGGMYQRPCTADGRQDETYRLMT